MKTYYLFLDESLKSDTMKNLVFGGFVIDENIYKNTIVTGLKQLKSEVFSKTDVILHEYDLRRAKGDYVSMGVKAYREKFWTGLGELLNREGLYTMASVVDMALLSTLYDNGHSTNVFAIALLTGNYGELCTFSYQ